MKFFPGSQWSWGKVFLGIKNLIITRIKEGSRSYMIYSLEGLIIGGWVFEGFGSAGYQWYN